MTPLVGSFAVKLELLMPVFEREWRLYMICKFIAESGLYYHKVITMKDEIGYRQTNKYIAERERKKNQ